MIKIVSKTFKYILAVITVVLAFLLCWGSVYMIGNIVMKLFGVL